jgi:predicted transcriptional regulator
MKISELTWRQPVVVDCDATIDAACRLMAAQGVGALIVVDRGTPTGIVTDRDVVTRGVAHDIPLDARVDSIMTMGLLGLEPSNDLDDLFAFFAHHAVRRVPIIDHDRIVGVVSLDDAIVSVTSNLSDLAKVLTAQILFPHAADEPPAPVSV